MKRVTGIGGIFFKSEDPEKLKKWYDRHLGIKSDEYGGIFRWRDLEKPDQEAYTAWGPFSEDTKYFLPSRKTFIFNTGWRIWRDFLKSLKKKVSRWSAK